ncbi:MAG TPA: c-type cytochrome biogenesis protein CcmI, partial [Usitatibacter sp.]
AEIRLKAAAAGKVLPAAPAAKTSVANAPDAAIQSVSGTVTLSPQLAAKVSGSDTLFIFARAEGGSRIPLAVMRGTADQLPLRFALDDSMAMNPAMRLSGAKAVRIEARISRSGNATPQPGDLLGASAVVKPGARDLQIVIDKVVP